MKKLTIILLLLSASFVTAQAQSKRQLRLMAQQVSRAFSLDEMKSLDSKGLRNGKVLLTIEHSSGDVEFEYHRFSSFAAMGRWLKKEERDGFPVRIGWPLTHCKNGRCYFDLDGGISHNHIYFTRLTYTYKNKRLRVTGIRLLQG